jgi:MGT family glycosyltransferase
VKKFLFTTLISNDLGLLTRSLPIARELRERGHQIAFCNPAKAPSKLISEAGFDNILPEWPLFYIMSGDTSLPSISRLFRSKHIKRDLGILASFIRHMTHASTAEIWNVDQFTYLFGMWNETSARAMVNSLMELINDYEPDVVVDFWNPGACIAARACQKPLISVIQADVHPQSRGFIWWKETPADLPTPVAAINAILEEHQMKSVDKTGELFIGDMTLVVGMPETDPLPAKTNVTYIGPILWQRADEKLPDWFVDLSPTKPVIWLYSGTPQYSNRSDTPFDSSAIVYACIEALKDMAVQVVLSTGHQSLPKDVLPLPPNFQYASFVPGLTMAERSDLLIHHGGYGSCQTGLYTGTPALAIPTFSERESNARRIAALGAGDYLLPTADVSGRKKHVQPAEVREKVNRILSDASFKMNCRRISQELKSYGGASYAASLIEDFAGSLSSSNVYSAAVKIKTFRGRLLSNKRRKNE